LLEYKKIGNMEKGPIFIKSRFERFELFNCNIIWNCFLIISHLTLNINYYILTLGLTIKWFILIQKNSIWSPSKLNKAISKIKQLILPNPIAQSRVAENIQKFKLPKTFSNRDKNHHPEITNPFVRKRELFRDNMKICTGKET
jgi:hypothetical protein